MALNTLDPVRQLRNFQFRRSPEFNQAVIEAEKLAYEQTFCSPLEYARSRAGNGFAGPRELTTWRAVHERLRAAKSPAAQDGAAKGAATVGDPGAAGAESDPAVEVEVRTFAVRLTTVVGPGSPAARLSALADADEAAVKVVMDQGEPVLVYTVPTGLAGSDFNALSVQA